MERQIKLPGLRLEQILELLQSGKTYTAKEIANESGDNLKTIQTRIYRAREMLKKNYRKEWLEA